MCPRKDENLVTSSIEDWTKKKTFLQVLLETGTKIFTKVLLIQKRLTLI